MCRNVGIVIAVLGALPMSADAQPGSAAKGIAAFVDEQTLAVVRVDITKVKIEPLFDWIDGLVPDKVPRAPVEQWLKALAKAGVQEAYAALSLSDGFDAPFAVMPLGKNGDAAALKPMLATLPK